MHRYLILIVMLLTFSSAMADVKVQLKSFKVVNKQNKESLIAAKTAKPGDLIEYQATYKNTGKKGVQGVMATLPIPSGMHFVPNSVSPKSMMVSLDGKHFSKPPLKKKIVLSNGGVEYKLVPHQEYRFLRWNLDKIPAGKKRMVTARVKVVSQ